MLWYYWTDPLLFLVNSVPVPFPTFSQVPEVTLAPVSEQPIQGPPSDEVTDLRQRLAILQQKRADDKARIKELEKYKAQLMQVSCVCV